MLTGNEKNFGYATRAINGPRISGNNEVTMSSIRTHEVRLPGGFLAEKNAVPMEQKIKWIETLFTAGLKNIILADIAGHAHTFQVEKLFTKIRTQAPTIDLAAHFHNTYDLGLANCFAAMFAGVKYLESDFAGLGGCPFTKLRPGNVSTEDLVHSLQRSGLCKEINLEKLIELTIDVSRFFDQELPGFVMKSGSIVNFKKKE